MKKLFGMFALTAAFVFTFTHSASSENCSCSAPDGSCRASISCRGGCEDFCGNDGACGAQCSDSLAILITETTIEVNNGGYPQLVTQLARVIGTNLEFLPTKPDPTFNLSFKRIALWDALEFLSDRGTVHIWGKDFESLLRLRKSLLSGEHISVGVQNTPVNTFVNDLSGLTGLRLRISAGRQMAPVNIAMADTTLDDLLSKVSEQTGTKIVIAGDGSGPSLNTMRLYVSETQPELSSSVSVKRHGHYRRLPKMEFRSRVSVSP
jgi:hypothetical protein